VKVALVWSEPELPNEAWGYYDYPKQVATGELHMYCKITRGVANPWYIQRSLAGNSGYDFPVALEGATTMEEAKQLAQVHFWMDERVLPKTPEQFHRELDERARKEREDERDERRRRSWAR